MILDPEWREDEQDEDNGDQRDWWCRRHKSHGVSRRSVGVVWKTMSWSLASSYIRPTQIENKVCPVNEEFTSCIWIIKLTELTSLDWRTSCFTSSYTFWLLTISSNTRWLQWHPRNSFNSSLDPEKNKDQALKIFWRSVGEFLHLILILCSNALNSSFCKHFGMSSVFEKLTIPVSNILTIFLMTSIFSFTGLDMYSDVVFSLSKTAGFTWNLLVFCFEKCGVNSVIITH